LRDDWWVEQAVFRLRKYRQPKDGIETTAMVVMGIITGAGLIVIVLVMMITAFVLRTVEKFLHLSRAHAYAHKSE
jgi:hypothetical protein